MGTESLVQSAVVAGGGVNFEDEVDFACAAAAFDLERDELNIFRSGSAPPTVQGSRSALGSIFGDPAASSLGGGSGSGILSEEELRSHPEYLSYYFSNEHVNPRLPPPMVSKEDWRAVQRFRSGGLGGIGDRRQRAPQGDVSLFSLQPLVAPEVEDAAGRQVPGWAEKAAAAAIMGLGARRKSFVDALQGNLSPSSSPSGHPLRPNSRNAFDSSNPFDLSEAQHQNRSELSNGLQSGSSSPSLVRVRSLGSSMSQPFAGAVDPSLSRIATPDPQLIQRSPSPNLSPVGVRMGKTNVDKTLDVGSSLSGDISGALSAMSNLSISRNSRRDQLYQNFDDRLGPFNETSDTRNALRQKFMNNADEDSLNNLEYNAFLSNGSINNMQKFASDSICPSQFSRDNAFKKISSNSNLPPAPYENSVNASVDSSLQNLKAYSSGSAQSLLNNQLNGGGYGNVLSDQVTLSFKSPVIEPTYDQYYRMNPDAVLNGAASLDRPSGQNYINSIVGADFSKLAYLLAQQKAQYGMPFLSKADNLSYNNYGDYGYGMHMPYAADTVSSSFTSPQGRSRQAGHMSRASHTGKSSAGGSMVSWNLQNSEEGYAFSLLDEFKNNKARSFELSDIVGHVVEFSSDQYGSRFIQQKLETATVEEKNKIFPEILPHSRSLMTDVFGNYVVQKFFEHGTETQRKQLASLLRGHVLHLSLQMYGCRVIQKALEVVDVEQQTQMASELDGSIMKCVLDQNGNHVIQKCIEFIPQDRIQFITLSFSGHVVELSTHPYGCRVIQRVLEYCSDPKTQDAMMAEIMQSVTVLAQDQYGNYVIQHVLQHGKPEERSTIIRQLAGNIVKMSQQKFASNVVEKCLIFGTPAERQLLINEMLGSTDENEPLQVMMKDQFGNYVVQKVLETCDEHNRELILSRIKVHLNALKRYTYGKHIVTRVEKLVTAGERRNTVSSAAVHLD